MFKVNFDKNILNKKTKILFVWLLAIISIFIFYNRIIINPNNVLFNIKGDAVKNYYVYKYYIDDNKSFTDFEGMNYPYGENFIYIDAQLPVSYATKVISKIFPSIKNIDFAIMHYLIFLSFIISIVLFFKIFEHFKVNFFYSLIGALAISLMSPQFMRIYGHYSLSYEFIYPLIIYLSIKEFKFSSLLISITTIFAFFMHPYIGLSVFIFTFLVNIFKFIFNKDIKFKKIAFDILIQSIIPILIFYITTRLLDTHTNRSTNPAGLDYYHSYLKTIFIAAFEPLKSFYKLFINFSDQPFEGISYIGIISNIGILFIFISLIKKVVHKTSNIILDKQVLIFLLVSSLLLIFSFGIPHVFLFPKLLDLIPLLRQFRGLGRFAWFFYYIINISSVIILFYFYKKFKGKVILSNIFTVLLLIFFTESLLYQKSVTKRKLTVNNYFDIKNASVFKQVKQQINTNNYQAILPIPFYHVGSEDFGVTGSSESVSNSMFLSYHLNMPILGSMGSRTSVIEAKKSLGILLPKFYKKLISDDITDKRNFLIIKSKGELNSEEQFILSKSKLLYNNELFSLYSIKYSDLFEYKKYKNKLFKDFNILNDSLHQKQGFVLSDTNKYFKFIPFDDNVSITPYMGKGSLALNKKKHTIVYKIDEGELNPEKNYTFNFWTYNKGYGRTSFQVVLEEHDGVKNESNWHYSTDTRFSKIILGDWSLIEFKVKPLNNKTSYSLYFPGRNNGVDSIYIDNILIRESDLDVYKKLNNNELFYNNFVVKNK